MTAIDAPSSVRTGARAFGMPIYAIEGACLGLFMISACLFGTLLEHPNSPVRQMIASAPFRRVLMGLAMGLTCLLLVYSPFGRRSGPHMNPAMTLCFRRLRRISTPDAVAFIIAQFIGGAVGVLMMDLLLGAWLGHPSVNHVATKPGPSVAGAWFAEAGISFVLVSVVLSANRVSRLAAFTGCFAAALVAIYISVEAPVSGMSMNPARSLASALFASEAWGSLWIYFTAPPLGMLAGVEVQRWLTRDPSRLCGKLTHPLRDACVFRCNCRRPQRIEPDT